MQNKIKNETDLCIVHVNSTVNNTIVTATDVNGKVLSSRSVGSSLKSKRGKRSVPQGSLLSGEIVGSFLKEKGFTTTQVRIKGFGGGRDSAIQGLISSGIDIVEILDITRAPHNGCRPKKVRRI